MSKYAKYYKDKFILTGILFFIYILFLDDIDIFTIINQTRKLHQLEAAGEETREKLDSARHTLKELRTPYALESFAREKKLFKKKDEDIFVISYE